MSATTTETKTETAISPASNGSAQRPAQRAPLALPETTGQTINPYASDNHFVASQRMAQSIAASTLVPKEYQGNLPNVLIAMEMANRIGASVFAVMQNLDIIHGRPSWRATFLIATVNDSKQFTKLRFRFQGKEGAPEWGCRAWAKDSETGEECVGTLITMAMAKAEGWSTKNGSKWLTMPEQMLAYRAASFWTRLYAPESVLGMHSAEEVIDMEPGADGAYHATRLPMQAGDVRGLEAALLSAGANVPPKPDSKPARDLDAEMGTIKEAIAAAESETKMADAAKLANEFASSVDADRGQEILKFLALYQPEQAKAESAKKASPTKPAREPGEEG